MKKQAKKVEEAKPSKKVKESTEQTPPQGEGFPQEHNEVPIPEVLEQTAGEPEQWVEIPIPENLSELVDYADNFLGITATVQYPDENTCTVSYRDTVHTWDKHARGSQSEEEFVKSVWNSLK